MGGGGTFRYQIARLGFFFTDLIANLFLLISCLAGRIMMDKILERARAISM